MTLKEFVKGVLYKGKPVKELNKEELLEALYLSQEMYFNRGDTIEKLGKLIRSG